MEATATRGRPRDPEIDRRILDAVTDLYAEVGWHALSMDAVALRAKVGKAALYRRFPSKAELLTEALVLHVAPIATGENDDTGSLEGDLRVLCAAFVERYFGERARAALRFIVEAWSTPEIASALQPVAEEQTSRARRVIRRAIARGEVPADTSPALVLDLVHGAVISRAVSTPPGMQEASAGRRDEFVQEVVVAVVAGIRT